MKDMIFRKRVEYEKRFGELREALFKPVDIASMVVFRMMFGSILFLEVWRFFANDWIRQYYIRPKFYFKYFGFEWIHPWTGEGMYIHFLIVGICAFCVITGLFYRITSWLLFLGFTFWFLLDQTQYLNHHYMTALMAFLMAVVPAHHAKSFDVRLRPKLRSNTVPAWSLWLLRAQLSIVYFYAGIAKLNLDWLQGEPLRQWLGRRAGYPLIGSWISSEAAVWFFSYGGIIFDLAVAPALLWRKTRLWAFAACIFFHFTNKMMFNIGIFPILMLAATLLMFPPDWPRKICLFFSPQKDDAKRSTTSPHFFPRKRLIETFLVTYLAIQLFIPLRHFLYPGWVHWTEEGHRFSWRMKLRQKRARARFYATEPKTGKTWLIDHRKYLNFDQSSRVGRWPGMCVQFAHFLADELKQKGHEQIEIRVQTKASLNGREYQYLIDPRVDLSKESRHLWRAAAWIVPLEKPLRIRKKRLAAGNPP